MNSVLHHYQCSKFDVIISIYDKRFANALGGTRFLKYPSTEAATKEAISLSEAMAWKAALVEIPVTGGKGVVSIKGESLPEGEFESLDQYVDIVNGLKGRFLTGHDLNHSEEMFSYFKEKSPYFIGGNRECRDPSYMTAYGVSECMSAVDPIIFPARKKKAAGIHGLGKVGIHIAEILAGKGFEVYGCDLKKIDGSKLGFNISMVDENTLMSMDLDYFMPCSVANILNPSTIQRLGAKCVIGAANCQLADNQRDSELLAEKGIIYCPDFSVNAGGIIEVYFQENGYDDVLVFKKIELMTENIRQILLLSEKNKTSTYLEAKKMAQEKIEKMIKQKN